MIRLFFRKSTNQWLHRIDKNPAQEASEVIASVAAAFGLDAADVDTVEFANDALLGASNDFEGLRLAPDWTGEPPQQPTPTTLVRGHLIRLPAPPPDPKAARYREDLITVIKGVPEEVATALLRLAKVGEAEIDEALQASRVP